MTGWLARAARQSLLALGWVAPGVALAAPQSPHLIPDAFKDASAVVLQESHDWDFAVSKAKLTVKQKVLLLTREGFEQADQRIVYDSARSTIRKFAARTIRADGAVVEVPAELTRDAILFKDKTQERRAIQFTFPAVETGAVLEWEYEVHESKPSYFHWWNVQQQIPVLDSRFIVHVDPPAGSNITVRSFSRHDFGDRCKTMPRRQEGGRDVTEIICRSVQAFTGEPLSPPEEDTRLRILVNVSSGWITSLSDKVWEYVGRTTSEQMVKCASSRQKVRELAGQICPPGTPAVDTVNKVSDWVQKNIKVRASEFAWELEALDADCGNPDTVLERRGGAPVEVTLLTLALLQESGVTAHVALVSDRSRHTFDSNLPDSSQLEHMILQVSIGGEKGYLDPSCRFCQPGIPDWRYCGGKKSGILVSPQFNAAFVDVPQVAAKHNAERWSEQCFLATDGSARVEGTVLWQAQDDVGMRNRWEDLSEAGRREDFLQTIGGQMDDASIVPSDPDSLEDNMKVTYAFTARERTLVAGNRLLLHPRDVFSPRLGIPFQEDRQNPLWWRYPHSVRAEQTFILPEGFRPLGLPPPTITEGPGLKYESLWSEGSSDAELLYRGILTVSRTSLDQVDYPRVLGFASRLVRALQEGVVLVGSAGSSAGGER